MTYVARNVGFRGFYETDKIEIRFARLFTADKSVLPDSLKRLIRDVTIAVLKV